MGDYKTECPECGGSLSVVQLSWTGRMPLEEDGFSFVDAHSGTATEDEIVECDKCGKRFSLTDLMNDEATNDEATMKIIIHKGKPTPEDFKKIGEMIQEGYNVGINRPDGINWEITKVAEKRDWCEGKSKQEVEDELYRELETYDHKTLVEQLIDELTFKQRKEWVNQWHKDD